VGGYCRVNHEWHSDTLTGAVSEPPDLKRTTASDVEQKLRDPVLPETGEPTTTYSSQDCFLQSAVSLNWYPDFVHQVLAVQVELPSVASIKLA